MDIASDLKIVDLNETNYVIFKKGECAPQIYRVNELNGNEYTDDDVVVTCYKSYAHPQNGVFIYKIITKILRFNCVKCPFQELLLFYSNSLHHFQFSQKQK